MYLNEMMEASRVKQLYTDYQFPNHEPWNEILDNVVQKEIEFYSKFIKPGMIVLDAGCGTGNYATAFAKAFPSTKFIGIDFCEKSLEKANQFADKHPNLEFEHHDLLTPYKTTTAFDVILSLGVIHHLENQEKGLKNLTMVLKDAGTIILLLYSKYGLAKRNVLRNIVTTLTQSLDWDKRFEVLDKLKFDDRIEYFTDQKRRSRFQFIPYKLRERLKQIAGIDKPNRNTDADSFFHPIENLHSMASVLSLLEKTGLELFELNNEHPGGLYMSNRPFNDPTLADCFDGLSFIDKLVVLENLQLPINYTFAARKISYC